MIHTDLQLQYLANKKFDYSGMDSYKKCKNKKHFNQYKKEVSYQYNSRGFRDNEWPRDLQNAIWCIGDSFTVGIGQPVHERWSSLLEQRIGIKTINVSMDGACDNWISRKASYVLEKIKPLAVVTQWSYIERRESKDDSLPDEERKLHVRTGDLKHISDPAFFLKNCKNFKKCFYNIANKEIPVIHTFIPQFNYWHGNEPNWMREKVFWKSCGVDLDNPLVVADYNQLDFARDYHHYDIKTASRYATDIANSLKYVL